MATIKKAVALKTTSLDQMNDKKLNEIVDKVMTSKKGVSALKSMMRSVMRSAMKSAFKSVAKSPVKATASKAVARKK